MTIKQQSKTINFKQLPIVRRTFVEGARIQTCSTWEHPDVPFHFKMFQSNSPTPQHLPMFTVLYVDKCPSFPHAHAAYIISANSKRLHVYSQQQCWCNRWRCGTLKTRAANSWELKDDSERNVTSYNDGIEEITSRRAVCHVFSTCYNAIKATYSPGSKAISARVPAIHLSLLPWLLFTC